MDNIRLRLQKYFNGECTDAEKAEILNILEQRPELLDDVFPEEGWEEPTGHLPDPVTSARMRDTIIRENTDNIRTMKRGAGTWWAAAAAILILVAAGAYWQYSRTNVQQTQLTLTETTKRNIDTTIANNSNVLMQIPLADGSWIRLSPGGQVKFALDFRNNRRIFLEGKARFNAASDPRHPFSVVANEVITTALGTCFDVETGKHIATRVKLLEGKVAIAGTHMQVAFEQVILQPGDEFRAAADKPGVLVARSHTPAIASPATAVNATVITDHTLEFHNEKLYKVIDVLQAQFNRRIMISGVSRKATFTGEFNKTDALEDIVKTIAELNNLKVQQNDSTNCISLMKQ